MTIMSKEAMKEVLKVTQDGQFIWHPNADRLIEEGDYSNSPAMQHILRALRAKQEQGEPVAIIHRNEYNEYRLEPHDSFDIKSIPFNVDVSLYTTPPHSFFEDVADDLRVEIAELQDHVRLLEKQLAQQRTWVGLTDDDKVLIKHDALFNQYMTAGEYADIVQQLTEARLKDLNA
jgi:hypothetical protein